MNERKKLKKQLGDKYIFKMYLSVNEVKKLLSENPKDKHDTLFASLTVGCVKINAVVFPTPDKMLLGFDILVKDKVMKSSYPLAVLNRLCLMF